MAGCRGERGERGARGGGWGRGEDDGEPWATWTAARNGMGERTEPGCERCSCLLLLDLVALRTTPGLGTTICTVPTTDGSSASLQLFT